MLKTCVYPDRPISRSKCPCPLSSYSGMDCQLRDGVVHGWMPGGVAHCSSLPGKWLDTFLGNDTSWYNDRRGARSRASGSKWLSNVIGEYVMSAITRRSFLKTSCAAMGASVLCTPLVAGPVPRAANDGGTLRGARANVYMVFHGFAPSPDDTDHEPTTNTEIVSRLAEGVSGHRFHGPGPHGRGTLGCSAQ